MSDEPTRIRYLWLIRVLEWAIKRLGLWMRYEMALGFKGGLLIDVPVARRTILGVPFRRRVHALWCVLSGCEREHMISTVHPGSGL